MQLVCMRRASVPFAAEDDQPRRSTVRSNVFVFGLPSFAVAVILENPGEGRNRVRLECPVIHIFDVALPRGLFLKFKSSGVVETKQRC